MNQGFKPQSAIAITTKKGIIMNAKSLIVQIALGATVIAGFAACNQAPTLETLDFGDQIVSDAGAVGGKVPGVTPDNEVVQPIPEDQVAVKWVFPSSFPKACNTSANIVQNPKFISGLANSGFPGNNIPPATVANWQQANGSPQLSPVTGGIGAMGHGNPGYVQMWGYKDGGEAVRQVGLSMAGQYDVYFSVKQFNTATNPVPLRARFVASSGIAANPWSPPALSSVIDIPASSTTWTMYGPLPISISGTADTITLASSNLTPYAQAKPATVSWGQYDNVCILRKEKPSEPVDLAIRKQLLGSGVLTAGGTGTYQLNVLNLGGAIAAGPVTVTDPMPAGLTLLTASITATPTSDWNCAASTAAQLSCNYIGAFPVITGYASNIKFDVSVSKEQLGSVKNCARVNAANDTVPGNNVSCIKNPVKNPVISDPFELALSDALTQLEEYTETAPDEAEAILRATSGLKDTLKTQVRLVQGLTLEPLAASPDSFTATFQGEAGTKPSQITVQLECRVTYPPLKASCSVTIKN